MTTDNADSEPIKTLIESGDTTGIERLLTTDASLADKAIVWGKRQECRSDPLHFVSDCVAEHRIDPQQAAELARLLLRHGAAVDGANGGETPLLGATSLGAEEVANILIDAGADIRATSIFGAGPLHWAAYMGLPGTIEKLIARGADIEARCTEFGATPLFWAVHGFGPRGPNNPHGQMAAARALIAAGASIGTKNRDGVTAIDCSRRARSPEMTEMLTQSQ